MDASLYWLGTLPQISERHDRAICKSAALLVLVEIQDDCLRFRISSGAGLPLKFLSDGNFSIGIHGENSFLSSDLQLGIFMKYYLWIRKYWIFIFDTMCRTGRLENFCCWIFSHLSQVKRYSKHECCQKCTFHFKPILAMPGFSQVFIQPPLPKMA